MTYRVAGAFAVDPKTRESFLSAVTLAFSQSGPFEVWNFPLNEPVLTLVFGNTKKPSISRWRGVDGSCAVVDGDFFGLSEPQATKDANPAETLYREFKTHGAEGLKNLRSDAAYIVYDAAARRLTLARDMRGIAPMYYATLKTGLLFASDQLTLARTVPRTLDTNAFDYFLARGYVPAPWTMIQEVRKLPASYLLEATPGKEPHIGRYFWPSGKPKMSPSREDRNTEIAKLFTQSLRRRLPEGSPSAVMLSGGVDSTLLLGGLVRLLGQKPECFTFEYSDYQGEFNESVAAAKVASYFEVPHHRVACRARDLADRAASLVEIYGEPFTYGLHSFALDRIGSGVGPIFTGIGVEPWGINHSGYVTLRFRQLPKPLRLLGRTGLAMAKPFAPKRVARAGVLVWADKTGLPPALAPTLLTDPQRRLLYADSSLATAGIEASYDLLRDAISDFAGESELDQWRFLQQRSFGAETVYMWNTAWARSYGLELRHPFIDDDLNAYMARLSFSHAGKENQRNFAASIIPEELANAPKTFHTIPIATWFRGPLRDFIRSTLESRVLDSVFDKAVATHLIEDHLSGRADHGFTLWGLASFVLWSERVLNAQSLGSPAPATVAVSGAG